MKAKAVIGLGFGDEGKGLVTDYLCSLSQKPLVVRFSGGHQAGHTVVLNGNKHVFSNFGSGTLQKAPTFWMKYCTIDPVGLFNEYYEILNKTGIIPVIWMDKNCPVTTPFDKKCNENNYKNGSVGVGFGATIDREKAMYSLKLIDLFYKDIFYEKLKQISNYYKLNVNNEVINNFINCVLDLTEKNYISRVPFIEYSKCYNYDYIFEGSQGLMLDPEIGFFPNVTRLTTTTKHIRKYNPDLYLVTRAYQTRHGKGFMTNETIPHNIIEDPNETNVLSKYQGEFRRSLLDLSLIKYAISKDKYIKEKPSKTIVITCLDHIKNDYRFTYKGNIIECKDEYDFLKRIQYILGCRILTSNSPESKNIKEFLIQ